MAQRISAVQGARAAHPGGALSGRKASASTSPVTDPAPDVMPHAGTAHDPTYHPNEVATLGSPNVRMVVTPTRLHTVSEAATSRYVHQGRRWPRWGGNWENAVHLHMDSHHTAAVRGSFGHQECQGGQDTVPP